MAVASALVACGSGGGEETGSRADVAPVTTSMTVPAAADAVASTTVAERPEPSPAPTTAPPTTAVPVTSPIATTLPLPMPIAPPTDAEAPEPVVELGRVAIPAIGIDRPLYEGIRLPTFDLGPGHWPGTAEPGQRGNMVIGGHRTSGAADFRDLDRLKTGDQVVVTGQDGTAYTYVVESSQITGPFAAQVIYQTPESTATLFACHPPGSTRERIVVRMTLVG